MSLHFVLDGYNIINQVSSLDDGKLEERRGKLIRLIEMQRPQGSLKNDVTIVFDGQPDIAGYVNTSSVRVIFTSGESADDKIKEMVANAQHRKSIVVVTDDRAIGYHVRTLGAKVSGVKGFLEKIKSPQLKASRSKGISKTLERSINTELEEIWLKRDQKKN